MDFTRPEPVDFEEARDYLPPVRVRRLNKRPAIRRRYWMSIHQEGFMNKWHVFKSQERDRSHRLLLKARHAALYATIATAVVGAWLFLVAGSASQQPAAPGVSAAPTGERFEYFPDLYQNQAKSVEQPIATF